ncbi:MAG: efflux RND transporter periplasmic adaptor subunit [Candidatus Zixiibacteriota bacterium]|nr:MAG: efflux RND transporter periplasmic adaptor subunit [candidate division Zixibacteria bacterium]
MKKILYLIVPVVILMICSCDGNGGRIGGSGLMEADETIVSAETSGRVLSLAVDEGDEVKVNDTLAVIDPSRLELQLASARAGQQVARARLEAAQVQLSKAGEAEQFAQNERDRIEKLLQSGTATRKQMDKVEFDLTQAKLSRKSAEAALSTTRAELTRIEADINRVMRELVDCYPLAPIEGVVTEKYVEIGELVNPGKAVFKVSQLNSLWVKVYLPAGDFANIKVGDEAMIDTESGERQYQGKVIWTSEEAEFTPKNVQTEKSRANLVYAVKVAVDNIDGSLKIGMPVLVTIGE